MVYPVGVVCTTTRHLRYSHQTRLAVPKSRLRTKGDKAFAVVAPRLWNSLRQFLSCFSSSYFRFLCFPLLYFYVCIYLGILSLLLGFVLPYYVCLGFLCPISIVDLLLIDMGCKTLCTSTIAT